MDEKSDFSFLVSGVGLKFSATLPILMVESFQPFIAEETADYEICILETEDPVVPKCECVHEDVAFSVYADGSDFFRTYRDATRPGKPVYAVAQYDWKNKKICVSYSRWGRRFVKEIGSCFFHIAWEALLMHENRMMLHSACVETPLGGLLFTGVSGAGKSTQAALWCEHGGGRLINGDRTILHKEENGWVGYGSPYAGSSKCYVNEGIGVRAIVAVKKADKNEVRRLSLKEAFRTVYSGLTVNTWDREFVSKACDFALELVSEVPVYELACTPDRGAVEALQAVLGKEERI